MKMDISSDPKIIDMIERREITPRTAENYTLRLKQYCEFHGMTPSQLIKEAREDQINEPWMDDRRIQRRLLEYNKHVEPLFTYKTRKTVISIIRSFYNEYEIALPKMKVRQDLEDAKNEEDQKIPTIDHIRSAVELANSKYKGIILLLATSGMGINEMIHITLQDYYTALGIEKYDPSIIAELKNEVSRHTIPSFKIFRRKTRYPYTTFCTPEAMEAINEYLRIEYQDCNPPTDPNTPLFQPYQYEIKGTGLLTRNSLSRYFRQINQKMGWGKSGSFSFFHPHTLRRFFATTLTMNRVPELYVHWFLGHTIPKTTEAYFKSTPIALKTEYIRIIPYLSLKKTESRIVEDERLLDLEERYEAKFKEKDAEIAELKRSMSIISDHNQTPKPFKK